MAGKVNMAGVWLVYYGIEGCMEGNMVMSIREEPIDKDTLIAEIQQSIYDALPDNAKTYVDAAADMSIIIRNMTRLGDEI